MGKLAILCCGDAVAPAGAFVAVVAVVVIAGAVDRLDVVRRWEEQREDPHSTAEVGGRRGTARAAQGAQCQWRESVRRLSLVVSSSSLAARVRA